MTYRLFYSVVNPFRQTLTSNKIFGVDSMRRNYKRGCELLNGGGTVWRIESQVASSWNRATS